MLMPRTIAIVNNVFFILCNFKFSIINFQLSHNDLLCSDIVALDEAEHVDTSFGVDSLAVVAAEGLTADDTSGDIDHLQGSGAFDAEDHEVAVGVEEAEVVTHVGLTGDEHQFEA